jgi:hypothetical protein
MGLGQHYYESFLEEHFGLQIYGINGWAQKTDINFSVQQRLILERGKNVLTLDLDGRKPSGMLGRYLADHSTQSGGDTDLDNS